MSNDSFSNNSVSLRPVDLNDLRLVVLQVDNGGRILMASVDKVNKHNSTLSGHCVGRPFVVGQSLDVCWIRLCVIRCAIRSGRDENDIRGAVAMTAQAVVDGEEAVL
jgi:hypothetical protein